MIVILQGYIHFISPILRRRYSQLSPLSKTLDTFAFRKVLYMQQPMKVKYIQRKFAFLVHIKQELVCGLFSNFLALPFKIYHVKTLKSCPFPSICIENLFSRCRVYKKYIAKNIAIERCPGDSIAHLKKNNKQKHFMLCQTKRVVDNVQSLNISEAVILFLDAYIIISESLRLVELILR